MMRSKLLDPHPWKMWAYVWNNREKGILLPSFIGGFFLLAIGIPYGITNRVSEFIGWTAFDPELPLDSSISYIPIMNIAYFSFYIYYILIPLFARTEVQRKCAIIFSQRLFVVTLPVFLMFLLLPVEVDLRSEIAGDDILTTLLSLIHGVDQPYNAWPSLHVGHSLCVVLAVPLVYNVNKFAHAALWVAWLLLSISTMTTQQHYLFDVITGILFALVVHHKFIRPVVAKCIEGEYDDAFQQL
jgi:hypothetical protein